MATVSKKARLRFSLATILTFMSFCAIFFAAVSYASPLGFLTFFVACIAWANRLPYRYIRRSVIVFLSGLAVSCVGIIIVGVLSRNDPPGPMDFGVTIFLFGGMIALCGNLALVGNLLHGRFEQ